MIALAVGLFCFLLHAAVTLCWLRLPGRVSPVTRHGISAIGTHVLGIVLAALFAAPFAYWPAAAVSGFLAVCWLFTFSAVYKSVSLRILTRMAHVPGNELSFDTITDDHVRSEFAARVAVLVKMGCAEETADGYAITGKGSETARRVALIQRACGIGQSGMYGGCAMTEREAA
jgi:hypothetical protein